MIVTHNSLDSPAEANVHKMSEKCRKTRKSVVSIKFPPVILGAEMAAPILWAPGIFWFFLLENPHAHKILPFRGGCWGFLEGGGGSADFIFMGVGIFPKKLSEKCPELSGGAEDTIFRHFSDIFGLFGRCLCLMTLSIARPLQAYELSG